jgi:hypothetical protein
MKDLLASGAIFCFFIVGLGLGHMGILTTEFWKAIWDGLQELRPEWMKRK